MIKDLSISYSLGRIKQSPSLYYTLYQIKIQMG